VLGKEQEEVPVKEMLEGAPAQESKKANNALLAFVRLPSDFVCQDAKCGEIRKLSSSLIGECYRGHFEERSSDCGEAFSSKTTHEHVLHNVTVGCLR
jgi:hypothetical protein